MPINEVDTAPLSVGEPGNQYGKLPVNQKMAKYLSSRLRGRFDYSTCKKCGIKIPLSDGVYLSGRLFHEKCVDLGDRQEEEAV